MTRETIFSGPTDEQLNALQDAGIISDLCVTWADVAPVDKERALVWLEQQKTATQESLI